MSQDSDFASLMESMSSPDQVRTAKKLRPGQVVEGPVVQIGKDSVFVDVGAVSEGRIERAEFEDKQGKLSIKVGDRIRASVVKVSDVMGPVLSVALGKGQGKAAIDVSVLENARSSGLPVSGSVQKAVKGGIEVLVGGIRAFCPASQVDSTFIADLATFEGQTLLFRVTEVRDGGRSVVLSRKAVLEEERKRGAERLIAELQVGNDYEATVMSVQKYGAFVELGAGVEGLVHVSELAHGRVERVEDVLNTGEKVRVKLLGLEPGEKGGSPRLRLSLKALIDAPVVVIPEAGEILEGTVSKLSQFGIFVDTAKGSGLVPVRELGIPKGADFRKAFPVGKVVQVVFVARDEQGRITFSIERVASVEERRNYRDFATRGQAGSAQPSETSVGSFGALLQKKLGIKPSPAALASPATAAGLPPKAAAPKAEAEAAPAPFYQGDGAVPAQKGPGPTAATPRDANARDGGSRAADNRSGSDRGNRNAGNQHGVSRHGVDRRRG
ncbi:MAG TPA: S1 RNA-binding domain-containing protein [Polyangiaceae bacterium]|jgi:small subunit ribosomal protein S1|nr:S1 RNA-binding domain-containing protein [Polyangiaceae bacterium]